MPSDYRYTTNWTDVHTDDWRRILGPLIGRPFIAMAEIGCWEGRSSRWFAENILTGVGSALVCVDPWPVHYEGCEARFDYNTLDLQAAGKIVKVKATSRWLIDVEMDAIYVDGDHTTAQTLLDLCNAWAALRPGGILLVDDIHERHPDLHIDVLAAVVAFGSCMGVDVAFTKAGNREQAVIIKPSPIVERL